MYISELGINFFGNESNKKNQLNKINLLKKKIIHLIKVNEKKWLLYLKKKNIGNGFEPANKKVKKLIKIFV